MQQTRAMTKTKTTTALPAGDSAQQASEETVGDKQSLNARKSSAGSTPIIDAVSSNTADPGCSGKARQQFRRKAVLVENALIATRNRKNPELRLVAGRPSATFATSGTAHVAGSKSFASLGHAVIALNRCGRSDVAPGPGNIRQSLDSTAVNYGHSQMGINGGFLGIGGETAQLVLADEDSTRPIDTTLVYEFFGMFFIRCSHEDVYDFDSVQLEVPQVNGCVQRYRAATQRGLRRAIRSCWSPVQVLGATMTVLLTANFIRSMFSVQNANKFDFELAFKLTWIVYWYEAATRAACAQWIWWRQANGSMRHVFVQFDVRFFTDSIVPYETSLRKLMYVMQVVTFLSTVLVTLLFAYGLFTDNDDLTRVYKSATLPYDVTAKSRDGGGNGYDWSTYVVMTVVVVTAAWCTAVSWLFVALFVVVCYVLYKEFEYLGRTFEMKITADGTFSDDIERCRLNHQQRCKMVDIVDELFKYFVANTYFAEVIVEFVLLYSLLDPNMPLAAKAHGVFWLCYIGSQTMAVSVAAVSINTQAHSILASIYNIQASNATLERQLEIEMFLNKLTRTSIGVTALDMFVVDKPAMLTITGILITAFFLMLQFQNPLQDATHFICACSSNMSNRSSPLI